MSFAERLKLLRTEAGMSQEELGKKVGLKKSAIAKYENGRVQNIKQSTIKTLATIFQVSPQYLMGWTDDPNEKGQNNMKINGQRLTALRKERGKTMDDLANLLGVAMQTEFKYEHGIIKDVPMENLKVLARELKTTPAYLTGETDDPYNYYEDPEGRLDGCTGPWWETCLRKNKWNPELAYKEYYGVTLGTKEDKAAVCKALLPVLRMTRDLYDLVDLKYTQLSKTQEEVKAVFSNGAVKTVNVSMDSECAMIRDIILHIQ